MNKPVVAFITAIGVALVVTAFGLHPQVSQTVSAATTGGAGLEEAALGENPAA